MNNKSENENEGKTLKHLLDRTLHKNTGLNVCLLKAALYPFSYTSIFKLSYYQTRLKKYFFVSFIKKISSNTHRTHMTSHECELSQKTSDWELNQNLFKANLQYLRSKF